jgi:hypothetical protein
MEVEESEEALLLGVGGEALFGKRPHGRERRRRRRNAPLECLREFVDEALTGGLRIADALIQVVDARSGSIWR